MADNSERTDFLHKNDPKFEEEVTKQQKVYVSAPPSYAPTSVVVGQPLNPQPGQGVMFINREELPPNGNAICFSVFVLLCCSLPMGIVALVFASK